MTSVIFVILTRNSLSEFQSLGEKNARLGEENKKLRDRLLRLEEQLNTDSKNSSKPPSQDPFRKARQATSSGRKPGGQLGHPGHMRQMIPLDEVTRVVEVKPTACPRCGTEILASDSIAVRHHQVVELATPCWYVSAFKHC